jgi:subfamily B ATP-binding cassette protein MsbA
MQVLVRFFRELRPYVKTMALVAVLTIFNAVLSLQIPAIIGNLFNRLTAGQAVNLGGVFGALVGIAAVLGAAGFVVTVLVTFLGQRFMLDMRRKLYAHLQTLSQGYFEKAQTGKLVSTVTNDVGQVNALITSGFVTLLQDGVTLFGVLFLIFRQDPRLALLALSVYPIYVVNYLVSRKRLEDNAAQISELRGVIYSDLQEKLAGIQVVKSYARERFEVRNYTSLNHNNLNLNVKQSKMGTGLWVRAEFISAVGTAIVLAVGGNAVISGTMRPGDLVQFLILATVYLYAPTVRLIQMNDQIARTQAGLDRIFGLLDTAPTVEGDPSAPALPPIRGDIRYENVWFAYEPEQYVLKNINLAVKPGQLIAFVGGSGSGKTTMIALLSRHYDVTKGKLTIDGHDVRAINLHSLREQIGVVLQESVLFHATVMENLRYGRLDATDDEIIAAARAGEHPPRHRGAAPGLRHQGRRGRRQVFGRRKTAARHRPRAAGRPAYSCP